MSPVIFLTSRSAPGNVTVRRYGAIAEGVPGCRVGNGLAVIEVQTLNWIDAP